jgi:hypothetical protein
MRGGCLYASISYSCASKWVMQAVIKDVVPSSNTIGGYF